MSLSLFRDGVEVARREKEMETSTLWGTIWEFPKIRGTFLGVPIIRTLVY